MGLPQVLKREKGQERDEAACELYELLNHTVVPTGFDMQHVYDSLLDNANECREAMEPVFIAFLGISSGLNPGRSESRSARAVHRPCSSCPPTLLQLSTGPAPHCLAVRFHCRALHCGRFTRSLALRFTVADRLPESST